jgi:hypothetical protein
MTYSGPAAPSPEPEGDPFPAPVSRSADDYPNAPRPLGRSWQWWPIGAALIVGFTIGVVLTLLIT